MQLRSVDRVENISAEVFKKNYYEPLKPLVINRSGKKMAGLYQMELGFF